MKPAPDTFQPAWEIAHLFPLQGTWSEEDYLVLTSRINRLVELSDAMVEVLPMPTRSHQRLVLFLYRLFYAVLEAPGIASVLTAPLRVRLWEGKIREPDLVVMLAEHQGREHEQFFEGADLVVEVVSPDDPDRDRIRKRVEYAQAGISEYWMVEPQSEEVLVLQLRGVQYTEFGRFQRGDTAHSALFPELQVEVTALFDAASA